MANSILAVHIAPQALKLVEISDQAKEQKVLKWSVDYFPQDKNLDNLAKALANAIKNKKITSKTATLILSGPEVSVNLIDLPNLAEKEVDAAIKFKLETSLHFSLDNVFINYYKLPELSTQAKIKYFVIVVQRAYIDAIIAAFLRLGISVQEIVAAPTALLSASSAKEKDPHALVYLGKYSTIITLVKNNQVVFTREVEVGGENITQSMIGAVQTEAGKMEFDYAKAEALKNTYGIPLNGEEFTAQTKLPALEVIALMRPALEKINDEILRTFAYYKEVSGDQTEFKKAFFTGGVSKTKNFIEYYSQALGIKIDPMPIAIKSDEKGYPDIMPYISIAIGGAVVKKPYLSLLPKEYTDQKLIFLKSLLNGQVIFLAYILVLSLVFGFYSFRELSVKHKQSELAKKVSVLSPANQRMVLSDSNAAKLVTELNIRSKTDKFTKFVGEAHRTIPEGVYFRKLTYDRISNQILVNGIVVDAKHDDLIANFMDGLRKSPGVKTITLSFLQETSAFTVPAYEFQVVCALNGDN